MGLSPFQGEFLISSLKYLDNRYFFSSVSRNSIKSKGSRQNVRITHATETRIFRTEGRENS